MDRPIKDRLRHIFQTIKVNKDKLCEHICRYLELNNDTEKNKDKSNLSLSEVDEVSTMLMGLYMFSIPD